MEIFLFFLIAALVYAGGYWHGVIVTRIQAMRILRNYRSDTS